MDNAAQIQNEDLGLSLNDALGLAFTCDGGRDQVDAWVESHCRLYLAHTPAGSRPRRRRHLRRRRRAPAGVRPACIHSGGDGQFHPLWFGGPTAAGDTFSIALRCDAPDEERARGIDAYVALGLLTQFSQRCGADLQANDGVGCGGQVPGTQCVESEGDGVLHGLLVTDPLDCRAYFGIALLETP
ncbi:MAG: hypothetical protein R3F43_24710 [bacterium]